MGNWIGKNNEHEDGAVYEPPVHVLEEELLHALRFLFADLEVVGWVQIDQREGFHRALNVKEVPVNDVDSFTECLLVAACVKYYAVPRTLLSPADFSNHPTFPYTLIHQL